MEIKENEMICIREEIFRTSDGVGLFTRAVFSKAKDRLPIVFVRTPYETADQAKAIVPEDFENNRFVNNGFALVTQHVRGRGLILR